VDFAPSAVARKSPWCAGRTSPVPRLDCAVDRVMDSKWRCGGGKAQVRSRPGGPGAVREPERRFNRARRLSGGAAWVAPCSTDPGATTTQIDLLQAQVRQLLQQQLFSSTAKQLLKLLQSHFCFPLSLAPASEPEPQKRNRACIVFHSCVEPLITKCG
jgi:hypothetical protein